MLYNQYVLKGVNIMFNILLDGVLTRKKVTNKAMAERMSNLGKKISKESIAKYRDGSRTPDPETISFLADALGIHVQDLFAPEQKEIIAKEEIVKRRDKYASLFPEIRTKDSMISLFVWSKGDMEKIHIDKRLLTAEERERIDENTMLFRLGGNEMEPYYKKNSTLFVDMVNGRNVLYADDVYLVRYGDLVRVRQVQFIGNGEVNLSCINKEYDDINPTREGMHWEILGKPFLCISVEHNTKFDTKG